MYHNGRGVPLDFEKAGYWIQIAASMGNTEAQNYIKSLRMSESTIDKVTLNLLTSGMTRANGHSKS
jgi:TPR repeat protein